jgi:hypothetical protein
MAPWTPFGATAGVLQLGAEATIGTLPQAGSSPWPCG